MYGLVTGRIGHWARWSLDVLVAKGGIAVEQVFTIRELRYLRGMTIRELSQRTGLSARALINIELGRARPNAPTLMRILEALAVDDPRKVHEFREVTSSGRNRSRRKEGEYHEAASTY